MPAGRYFGWAFSAIYKQHQSLIYNCYTENVTSAYIFEGLLKHFTSQAGEYQRPTGRYYGWVFSILYKEHQFITQHMALLYHLLYNKI